MAGVIELTKNKKFRPHRQITIQIFKREYMHHGDVLLRQEFHPNRINLKNEGKSFVNKY